MSYLPDPSCFNYVTEMLIHLPLRLVIPERWVIVYVAIVS